MTIKQLPQICGTEKLRIYKNNKKVVETWISGASLHSFLEENSYIKQFVNEEIDYIDICIEGCLSETLVMEIFLKSF
jgi:hypothetical protein